MIQMACHIIKRPIVPQITIVLSTKREIENFEYEKFLIDEAVRIIDLASEKYFRGHTMSVDATEIIQGLGFEENIVRCHFTIIFMNDYTMNNFLNRLKTN